MDKELLYNRRAKDFSKCCTYDIIFTLRLYRLVADKSMQF
jgi:hypothetical protein